MEIFTQIKERLQNQTKVDDLIISNAVSPQSKISKFWILLFLIFVFQNVCYRTMYGTNNCQIMASTQTKKNQQPKFFRVAT
jgi:hypothetical protein